MVLHHICLVCYSIMSNLHLLCAGSFGKGSDSFSVSRNKQIMTSRFVFNPNATHIVIVNLQKCSLLRFKVTLEKIQFPYVPPSQIKDVFVVGYNVSYFTPLGPQTGIWT